MKERARKTTRIEKKKEKKEGRRGVSQSGRAKDVLDDTPRKRTQREEDSPCETKVPQESTDRIRMRE